jgi:hypothetical protein
MPEIEGTQNLQELKINDGPAEKTDDGLMKIREKVLETSDE